MKSGKHILLASAALVLALSQARAETVITPGQQALLNGWDFDNILSTTLPASPVRGRYSDVFGNNQSPTALTGPGGIYFNGQFGSDNWGTVSKNSTGDINRDILTRSGAGSTFDLGGQTGGEGAAQFNNASVGTAGMNEFSINLHMADAVNSFKDLSLSLWGRDVGNTAGGALINWFYSLDAGVTKIATGLASSFVGNVFAESVVNFSTITDLNGQADIYLIGEVVESQASVNLNLDNIGAYAYADAMVIPEPTTYAALLGFACVGLAALRRRRVAQVA